VGAAERTPAAEEAAGTVGAVRGERLIARVLRAGAVTSGALFLLSMGCEVLPPDPTRTHLLEGARMAGASLLVATPVARLVVAGGTLGRRGEWRYALCAAGVLALLGVAVGAGHT
jgi:hypothetical protein